MAAATYDLTGTKYPGNWDQGTDHINNKRIRRVRYCDLTTTSGNIGKIFGALVSVGTHKLMKIPAGTLVEKVQIVVATGENVSCNIGDASNGSTFLATVAMSAAGIKAPWTTSAYYSAADEIQITPANAMSLAKFWLVVDYHPMKTAG